MLDKEAQELVRRSRLILEKAKRLPAAKQLEGLRKKGIIDSAGQVVTNGHVNKPRS